MRANQAMFVPIEDATWPRQATSSRRLRGFVEGAPLRGAKREGVLLEVAPGSLLENKAEDCWERGGRESRVGVSFANDYAVENCAGRKRGSRSR